MFTNSRFCYECSKKLSSSTEHAIILSSILKRSLLHHQWISTTVIHRQRPKHAQKLHRPAVFLDESDNGARSFETKTTLTVLNSTSFFLGVWPNNCAKVKNLYLCVKVSYYSLSLHKQRISFQFSLFLFFSVPKILIFFHICSLTFAKNSQEIA